MEIFFKNVKAWIFIVVAAFAVTACGSSSSEDDSSTGGSFEDGGSAAADEDASPVDEETGTTSFEPVSGLYDTSLEVDGQVDENYLYIDQEGSVTAYNYVGDSVDAGDNCYREPQEGEVNAQLTGLTLEWNDTDLVYSTQLEDGTDVVWIVDQSLELIGVMLGEIGATSLTIQESSRTIRLESETTAAITHSDIISAICE